MILGRAVVSGEPERSSEVGRAVAHARSLTRGISCHLNAAVHAGDAQLSPPAAETRNIALYLWRRSEA